LAVYDDEDQFVSMPIDSENYVASVERNYNRFTASIALSMSQMLSTNLSVFKDGALRYSALLIDISPKYE